MLRYKKPLSIFIILLTLLSFSYYFSKHRNVLNGLKHVSALTFLSLIGLYLLSIVVLVIILHFSLLLCSKKIKLRENLLITIYSTIVNFFGPLQSGPGVRALYLKKTHDLKIKSFLFVSLVYYGFFAFISGAIIAFSSLPAAISIPGVVFLALVIFFIFKFGSEKLKVVKKLPFDLSGLINLFLATLAQVLLVSLIYFVELHSINSSITIKQALAYTGVANFALFVSITPGALGFRESFLLFSQHIHHINTANILSASLIDRATYIVLLAILLLLAGSLHLKDRLDIKSTQVSSD